MKTKLLPIVLIGFFFSQAQNPIPALYGLNAIPIGGVADGNTNRTYKSASATTPIDETATGANQTWNFTNLTAGESVPFSNTLPTAGELTDYPGTTQVTTQASTAGNSNIYLKTSGATSFTGADSNGVLLNYSTNNATVGTFPLSYSYTNSDTMSGTYQYTTYSGNFTGTITSAVDAYGTLTTNDIGFGAQTMAVTRLKIVQNISLTYIIPNAGTIVATSYLYYRAASGDNFPVFISNVTTINVPLLSLNQTFTGYFSASATLLATPNFNSDQLSLAPNPVKDFLSLQNTSGVEVKSVDITDVNGRKILKGNPVDGTMDVSSLSKGVYFARIETDSGTSTKKIIKE